MANKPSGLGRGLDELIADNLPEVRGGGVVIKKEEGTAVLITPASGGPSDATVAAPKDPFEEKTQNKSLKANFRDFQ